MNGAAVALSQKTVLGPQGTFWLAVSPYPDSRGRPHQHDWRTVELVAEILGHLNLAY